MPDSSAKFVSGILSSFWQFVCQIPVSHNVHEFVSGAGHLPDQCACHILLVTVRIWHPLLFYQVLPSAVCHRQTERIRLGDTTFVVHRLPESTELLARYLRQCFHWLLFSLVSHRLLHRCISFLRVQLFASLILNLVHIAGAFVMVDLSGFVWPVFELLGRMFWSTCVGRLMSIILNLVRIAWVDYMVRPYYIFKTGTLCFG